MAFEFKWCRNYTLADVLSAQEGTQTNPRFCFLGTDEKRIYLVGHAKGLYAVPFVRNGQQWRPMFAHQMKTVPPDKHDLRSQGTLIDYLQKQMLEQFSDSIGGPIEEIPTASTLVRHLETLGTLESLKRTSLPWVYASVEEDPDWDGAIDITCSDGVVTVPFKKGENTTPFVLEYTMFTPYSKLKHTYGRVKSKMTGWLSPLRSFHLADIRHFIEETGR